jgi:hypothetical protein
LLYPKKQDPRDSLIHLILLLIKIKKIKILSNTPKIASRNVVKDAIEVPMNEAIRK